MPRVSHYWVKLAAIVAVFSLIVPVLATGTAAQDEGKVPRVHHQVYPMSSTTEEFFVNEIDILRWFTRG